MAELKINRMYKDRLFRLIFGDESNKANLLSLYNAINDTSYTDENDLEITTMEDCIYMGMKDDVSVLIHHIQSLYEQQSTWNPNMPLRGLMYFSHLYNRYIEKNCLNIYGTKLLKLPTPQYIVFYNGDGMDEDEVELRLSDSFEDTSVSNKYEWTAVVKNINIGKNEKLMDKCHILKEYSLLVDKVKTNIKIYKDIRTAIDLAIDECIECNVLKNFLLLHRAEVLDVCLTEYDEERVLAAIREEVWADGLEQGLELGMDKINILNQKLIADNRNDDLIRSFNDSEFQQMLLREYGLM